MSNLSFLNNFYSSHCISTLVIPYRIFSYSSSLFLFLLFLYISCFPLFYPFTLTYFRNISFNSSFFSTVLVSVYTFLSILRIKVFFPFSPTSLFLFSIPLLSTPSQTILSLYLVLQASFLLTLPKIWSLIFHFLTRTYIVIYVSHIYLLVAFSFTVFSTSQSPLVSSKLWFHHQPIFHFHNVVFY